MGDPLTITDATCLINIIAHPHRQLMLFQGRHRRRAVALALIPAHASGLGLGGSPVSLSSVAQSFSVAAAYEPLQLRPCLFDPEQVHLWLHPDFVEVLESVKAADDDTAALCDSLVIEEQREIFSFPLLRDEVCSRHHLLSSSSSSPPLLLSPPPPHSSQVCELLIDEVEHFQATGLPARRPNSMNNYGLILTEIGLKPSLLKLQQAVQPIARALFPLEGEHLDDFHSFVVSYKPHEGECRVRWQQACSGFEVLAAARSSWWQCRPNPTTSFLLKHQPLLLQPPAACCSH